MEPTKRIYRPSDMVFADADFFAAQRANLSNICSRCLTNGTDFDVCFYCMTDEEKAAFN